jgi:hypothetical protein
MRGGLVKNPSRVPVWSQIDDPKGRQPTPRHLIDVHHLEDPTMAQAKETGVYKDEQGNFVQIRKGDTVPEGYDYSHEAEDFSNPEANRSAEEVDPNVRAMNAAPENRMEPAPVENKAQGRAAGKDAK